MQKSLGYYQDGTVSAAHTLADIVGAAIPTGADFAYVQCQTQSCRWRDDGTAPTASVGMLLAAGDILVVESSQFTNFKIIQTTATAVVNVSFYRRV